MQKKYIWLFLSCLLVLSLLLASCGTKTSPTTSTTQTSPTITTTSKSTTASTLTATATTTTGKWWDKFGKPEYGGRLTIRITSDPQDFDPWYTTAHVALTTWMEALAHRDLTIDPSIWPHNIKFPYREYNVGLLAESWEQTDTTTVIFHLRKGIRYQDKPPMNGREFVADDIVYHWNRMLGLGSGFTQMTPYVGFALVLQRLESITAPDKYTVVFKTKEKSVDFLFTLLDVFHGVTPTVPREAVEKYGSVRDWKNAVGTGPFMLTDYVVGSSLTLTKNPNYWGYDERYPQNKLPYLDELKFLNVADNATALAALRTGKIDLIEDLTWVQGKELSRTSPELLQITRPALSGTGLAMRVDKAPFTDIRVRKAMQMAMDLKTIASTYMGDTVEPTPVGWISPAVKGFNMPYDEWAPEVKAGYTYDPAGAKKLLSEAGFPNGFKTHMIVPSNADLDFYQIVKAYLNEIGIDMEIRVMDTVSYRSLITARKHEACFTGASAAAMTPMNSVRFYLTGYAYNEFMVADPEYDKIANAVSATLDPAEQKKLIKDADYYIIKQQWVVRVLPGISYCIYQPWFKGYWGQMESRGPEFARYWVNSGIKK